MFRKIMACAGLLALALIVLKGRGKGAGWYARVPLFAYRYALHHGARIARKAIHPLRPDRAQHREDWLLVKRLGWRGGYCAEVGAFDGLENSNTLLFDRLGWRGLLVEADPEIAAACRRNRPRFTVAHAAAVAPEQVGPALLHRCLAEPQLSSLHPLPAAQPEGATQPPGAPLPVPGRTLDEMLEAGGAPEPIEFVTIDVEGGEYDVLAGFSPNRWQPRVIITERNQSTRDPRIEPYMSAHGYEYGGITPPSGAPGNDWWIRSPSAGRKSKATADARGR